MKIKITEPFETMRRKMGLSINKIKQTITNPDNATRMNLNKLQEEVTHRKAVGKVLHVGFYIKKYQKDDKDYHVFVNTREPNRTEKNVIGAYILTEDIIPNLAELSLINILRKLSDMFGTPINIQGKVQKFFYREVIPLKTRTNIFKVPKKEGEPWLVEAFFKIVSETNEVFCALVYSINTKRYLEWLEERELLI